VHFTADESHSSGDIARNGWSMDLLVKPPNFAVATAVFLAASLSCLAVDYAFVPTKLDGGNGTTVIFLWHAEGLERMEGPSRPRRPGYPGAAITWKYKSAHTRLAR
jgi:hypothetical protein